jgi:hypothetical protein
MLLVDERPREVCTGSFRIVNGDDGIVACDRCGTEVDWNEPALVEARGQHARLPQVPVGIRAPVNERSI